MTSMPRWPWIVAVALVGIASVPVTHADPLPSTPPARRASSSATQATDASCSFFVVCDWWCSQVYPTWEFVCIPTGVHVPPADELAPDVVEFVESTVSDAIGSIHQHVQELQEFLNDPNGTVTGHLSCALNPDPSYLTELAQCS